MAGGRLRGIWPEGHPTKPLYRTQDRFYAADGTAWRWTRWGWKMVARTTKKTGSFRGKSNKLGHGGRAAQLKAQGVPGGVIGEIARAKGAAPGQKNYHGGKK